MFLANKKGFNLIGLMMSVILVVILSTLVFLWLNPLQQTGSAKDKSRLQAINTLALAIQEYSYEHHGALPFLGSVTTTSKKVICQTQSGDDVTCDTSTGPCLRIADPDFYNNHLFELPIDPDKTSEQDTGYYVQKDLTTGQLIVGACDTYSSSPISKQTGLQVSCDVYAGGFCWYLADTAMTSCDTVCSNNGLLCASNASYEEDLDDEGNGYCALNRALGGESICGTSCVKYNGSGGIVANADASSKCLYRSQVIDCTETASGWLNICPCE